MGPYLVFAALLNGAAIALFNGPPLARPFGEFVDAARVTMLGLVPSIVRAWRGSDCMKVRLTSGKLCLATISCCQGSAAAVLTLPDLRFLAQPICQTGGCSLSWSAQGGAVPASKGAARCVQPPLGHSI